MKYARLWKIIEVAKLKPLVGSNFMYRPHPSFFWTLSSPISMGGHLGNPKILGRVIRVLEISDF